MTLLRRCLRILGLTGILLLGFLLILGHDVGRRVGWLDRHSKHRLAKWWYARLMQVMNVRVNLTREPDQLRALVAANHVSWLDIPVLGSVLPTYFLSKIEVGQLPVIGWLARRGGTLFIHRGKSQHEEVRKLMQALLAEGGGDRYLTFFPEATTGPGNQVLPFHPRLFAAAIETGMPVVPVAIHYISHGPVHPEIPFGEESMVANAWRILGAKRIDVEVTALPSLSSENKTRRELADTARATIGDALGVSLSPLRLSGRFGAAPMR